MVKVIGLGNRLRGDDGIGPLIIDRLEEKERDLQISTLDAGSDAFTVLEHLLGEEPVVIIDCANLGKTPGEFMAIDIDPGKLNIAEKAISLHGYSLAEVIQLAEQTGQITDGKIIAIQPGDLTFNSDLSPEVEKNMEKIIQFVIEEATEYGKKNLNH